MSDDFNPDLNKFETRDDIMETLLNVLARRIHENLPGNVRFSLFLYQEVEDQETANIFYCSSVKTVDALPLIETWCGRQVQ